MSERLNLLMTLERAIARCPVKRRTEMALQLAELFVRLSDQLSEPQTDLFDELITRIAADVDPSGQAALAQLLARTENAPVNLIRALANCSDIEVAYPVLAYSKRLDEGSLISHARGAGEKHLLAISLRKSLSEALTDALIERGYRPVILSVVKNPKVQISEAKFRLLAEQCERDEVLAKVLATRADILTLLVTAPEKIRLRFLAASPRARVEIDRALTAFSGQWENQNLTVAGPLPEDLNSTPAPEPFERSSDDNTITTITSDEPVGSGDLNDDVASQAIPAPTATTPENSGRRTVRQRTFLRGCLFFNNGRSSVECMIRDLTAQGARLLVSAVVNIPDVVELYIPQKDQRLRAQIAWRTQEEIGVSFPNASPSPADQSLSNAVTDRVTELEQQLGALRAPLMQIKRAIVDKL